MFASESTSLEIYSSAEAMVNSYQQGIKVLTEAYDLMEKAEGLLARAVSFPKTVDSRHRSTIQKRDLSEVIKENHKGAWQRIIEKMQLRHLLSDKRFKEVQDQIEKGEIPELTVENIFGLVQDMTSNMGAFLQECIAETFEWLIPFRNSPFKTNKTFKVGPKVIKEFMVDSWGVNYHREQHLISLDNVFHLLDGKGPIKDTGSLVTTIKQTIRDKKTNECETPYFKARWFKRGTLHIWFKRADLLAELNRIGAGGKPHIGKEKT
ncbi:MAG: DUF4942 domain-containing protein [Desulfobacteraceae bacterium]|nr:DUF4942 domain-containing protein [Desulfobacteraceae bacterium]